MSIYLFGHKHSGEHLHMVVFENGKDQSWTLSSYTIVIYNWIGPGTCYFFVCALLCQCLVGKDTFNDMFISKQYPKDNIFGSKHVQLYLSNVEFEKLVCTGMRANLSWSLQSTFYPGGTPYTCI